MSEPVGRLTDCRRVRTVPFDWRCIRSEIVDRNFPRRAATGFKKVSSIPLNHCYYERILQCDNNARLLRHIASHGYRVSLLSAIDV